VGRGFWAWLRWRVRLHRLRCARLARRSLTRPVRYLLAFWLLLAIGAAAVAVDRTYPQAKVRAIRWFTAAWESAAGAVNAWLPAVAALADVDGALGSAALRQGLPMGVWAGDDRSPADTPAAGWRGDVGAVVYALTRYDLHDPATLLSAGIPVLGEYNHERAAAAAPPTASFPRPSVIVAPAGDGPGFQGAGALDEGAGEDPRVRPPLARDGDAGVPQGLPPSAAAPSAQEDLLGSTQSDPARPSGGTSAPDWRERLLAVQWGDGCRVLIYHTHTSETYRTGSFAPAQADAYHLWNTTETGIVAVGRALSRRLTEVYGIPVCHEVDIHDWPSHPRAYIESRATVQRALARNPQIEVVLDIHRDAPEGLVATVAGQRVAQVALVVGTNTAMHPGWPTNLAFAQALAARISARYPGMFRRVIERPDSRLNQDLHPRAVLVEIGSYDNHLEEAVRSAELVADVLAEIVAELVAASNAR